MHEHHESAAGHQHEDGREVHIHQPQSALRKELITHVPFSVASVALGLVLTGIICFLTPISVPGEGAVAALHDHAEDATDVQPAVMHDHDHDHDHAVENTHDHAEADTREHDHSAPAEADAHEHHHDHHAGFQPMFHLFHPLHMFFSATATTAMFWRYDRRVIRAIIVGMIGAIFICGISDILMPHASLLILGIHWPLHICVIDHPGLVLPFAFIGVAVGLLAAQGVTRSTIFSHSLHVFASTMASIFYMVNAYGRLGWIDDLGWIFFFVILAVMVPCCLSDIVFPVAMSRKARDAYAETACCH